MKAASMFCYKCNFSTAQRLDNRCRMLKTCPHYNNYRHFFFLNSHVWREKYAVAAILPCCDVLCPVDVNVRDSGEFASELLLLSV